MKTIEEGDLCSQIGVPKTVLKEWRDEGLLHQGEHWNYGARHAIRYTITGTQRVSEIMESQCVEDAPAASPKAFEEEDDTMPPTDDSDAPSAPNTRLSEVVKQAIRYPGEPIEVTVTGIPKNRQLLVCGEYRVRLRNNSNFIVGMKLKAQFSGYDPTLLLFTGRAPRFRGHW